MTKEIDNSSIINEVYTRLSDIDEELAKRRKNKKLVKSVEDFLGDYLLPEFKFEARSVISRPIITPNREFRYFMDLNAQMSLKPLGLEYHDKFVAKNPDKYHLARLYFAKEREDRSQFTSSVKIVDFNKYEGKNFKDVRTLNGDSLIDFHHSILIDEFPGMKGNLLDITSWFESARNVPGFYYMYFLSLFMCHGVLFDNYLLEDKGEQDFFIQKIYPSFLEVKRIFGVKPLIFPLLPIEYEKGTHWMCYEDGLRSKIEKKINFKDSPVLKKRIKSLV